MLELLVPHSSALVRKTKNEAGPARLGLFWLGMGHLSDIAVGALAITLGLFSA